jgi:hypothetical protein
VLVGFTIFYRRFIRKYGQVTTPISDLLKKTENSRMTKQVKWECTRDAELAFWKLKRAFTDPPILNDFYPAKPIFLQTNACSFAIAGILNQYEGFRILRPVNYYSKKCTGAEQNHDKYDRDLLAIVETMKEWHHYL